MVTKKKCLLTSSGLPVYESNTSKKINNLCVGKTYSANWERAVESKGITDKRLSVLQQTPVILSVPRFYLQTFSVVTFISQVASQVRPTSPQFQ